MFFSVKNLHEHATIHQWHFSRSCEGFTNGMNTFFPDSSSFLSESGHLSGYLESVVQFPHEQCLVPTISYHKKPSNQMQCLSESCGGSNLFLESVSVAIVVWSFHNTCNSCWLAPLMQGLLILDASIALDLPRLNV